MQSNTFKPLDEVKTSSLSYKQTYDVFSFFKKTIERWEEVQMSNGNQGEDRHQTVEANNVGYRNYASPSTHSQEVMIHNSHYARDHGND